ncbi:hypothetical protein FIBSPDRAFT_730011 [Athelia psychrophila]|uniref:Macrofage activating glyco protein n=1 Tax=Athelia psychrophila TaxID=1759441 RepID=A0A166R3Y3_9AGAM|nr:hypothetical protein FIBSPDRAFT_730011 [Fibularhizoctonia sp. CBS 109695]
MASSRYLLGLFLLCTGALASNDASTITTSPPARRTPAAPLVQRATTYETTTPLPLTDYNYPYSALPYQVNPYPVGRGPQSGYNVCNSTTEGAASECQTLIANTLSDFCIWGSPIDNGQIGDVEAATVAYCTQPGHGTRIIPAGSITAAQFMKTSGYIQITGLFDQSGINLMANDTGGELDPHGADLFGNPLGGLVYSTGLPSGDNTTYKQVSSWNNFVGSGQFCIKLCDPTVTSPNYCKNEVDLIGCDYNMPASYAANEFTSCEGELQDVVGVYTSAGQTLTWAQPTDGILPATLPWQPKVPASSNCVTYTSAQLFGTASASSVSRMMVYVILFVI